MGQDSNLSNKAARHLGRPARLERTVPLRSGHIELWRSVGTYPPKLAPYYVGADAPPFRTNSSWHAFERMLRAAQPDLRESELLAQLVRYGPGRRVVALREYDVPEEYRASTWAPTVTAYGGWVAHCIETIDGRWERIKIGADYRVAVEDLGRAPKKSVR